MNIAKFLQKSGTWSASNVAYWNMTLQSFKISFSAGNPLFINESLDMALMKENRMSFLIKKFQQNLHRDRMNNSFDILSINKLSGDFIIFYKETSKVPIHGVFLFYNCSEFNVNFELSKTEILLDIAAYFKNRKSSEIFSVARPKFKILNEKRRKTIGQKLGLNMEQMILLKELNRVVIREYMKEVIYLYRYSELLSEGTKSEKAKNLVLRTFIKESKIYYLFFGEKTPKIVDRFSENSNTQIDNEKPKTKKSSDFVIDLSKNKAVTVLNKIHIHFRFQISMKFNILSSVNNLPESTLYIKGAILDILNPVANLRVKLMIHLNELSLRVNQEQYPIIQKSKLGIFGRNHVGTKQRSIINSDNYILSFRKFKASIDVHLKQARGDKIVIMIYSDNQMGSLDYHYYPVIFRDLAKKFVKIQQVLHKNFKTDFIKINKKNMKKLGGEKGYKKTKNIAKRLKGRVFKSKMNKIEAKRNKNYVSGFTGYSNIKKSNIKFDFEKSELKKEQNYKNFKKQVDRSQMIQFKSQAEVKLDKHQKQQELLENINKILQNIVLNLHIKTDPIGIKIFDEENVESLSFKYQVQDIKIELDLAFKEMVSIKAFGLEIQSRKSLYALQRLTETLKKNADEIKDFHSKTLKETV